MAILILSVGIQFFTALYAFRFIRRTGVFYPWLAVSCALLLMAVRRLIPLYRLLAGGGGSFDYLLETLGLVLSALMCFGVIGVGRVFAKSERARKKASASLSEKELLLREVNHRIKNNMHTIGALLRLQADGIEDAAARDTLMDAERRVDRMFRLYDRIYRTDEFLTVRTRDYFSSLMAEVLDTSYRGVPVRSVCDIEDFELDAQKTFYLGIILNELVSNSVKYAFGGVAEPEIVLRVRKEEGAASFTVGDNGQGMRAAAPDAGSGGFGSLLVESLVAQLDGKLAVETSGGTSVSLTVPLGDRSRKGAGAARIGKAPKAGVQ